MRKRKNISWKMKIIEGIKNKVNSIPRFIFNTSNWLPIIGYTLAISGFLNVIEYFSPYVNLEIKRTGNLNPFLSIDSLKGDHHKNTIHTHDLIDFRNFYTFNHLPIPNIAKTDKLAKRIFYPTEKDSERESSVYLSNNLSTSSSDLEFLKSMYSSSVFDSGMISYRANELEKQLGNLRFSKIKFIRVIPNSDLDSYETYLRSLFKQKSSKLDYYTFMCAILFSRRVENEISIKNKSEISLEDIKILIPSPESKLMGRKTNNILDIDYDLIPNLVYTTNNEGNNLVINIPMMKPNDFINLRIITRENEILDSDIIATFKERYSIIINRALKVTLIIFSILIVIQFAFFQENSNKIKK